jgi:hypothetical protein
LDGSKETRQADGNGRFHFDSVEQGRYLSITQAGYETTIVPVDRTTVGRIELELVRRTGHTEHPMTLSIHELTIPRSARKTLDHVQKDIQKGRLDRAETDALHAQARYRDLPEVHILLAKIYGQKKDEKRAVEELKMYLEAAPNGPHAEDIRRVLGM